MRWETALGGAFVAVCAVILVAVLVGCEEDSSSGVTYPTLSTPTISTPTPTPEPAPAEPSTSTPSTPETSSSYPLTEQQAYALVQGGSTVAGELPNGLEVLIIESSETVYERTPVEDEVCGYEYDYIEERDDWKCHFETVYKDEPVEKTVYVVRGGGYAPVSYDSITGAFATVSGYGVERWRRS